MNRGRPRLLVADDELAFRRLLKQTLELEGYGVDLAVDGAAAFRMASEQRYDLLMLDVMMPGLDGFEVCRRVRATSAVPIVVVTALAREEEIVAGLRAGADDYVTKPFSIPELVARVQAALRRTQLAASAPAPIRTGALVIDPEGAAVTMAGQPVVLTALELRLLSHLARNVGRVLTHQQLLRHGWGEGSTDAPQFLHVTLSRLRAKIEPDPAHPRYVLTRVGIGYTLAALPPESP
jgi:DNA-binding response OmpR family regulator